MEKPLSFASTVGLKAVPANGEARLQNRSLNKRAWIASDFLIGIALAGCVLLGACKPQQEANRDASAKSAGAGTSEAIHQTNSNRVGKTMDSANADTIAPPDEKEVVYFTYLDKVDGSSPYKIQNDSYVTFWFGNQYDIDGQRYYTGFTYATAERFGEDAQNQDPGPEDKVTIGQATFKRAESGAAKPWDFVGNQEYVGETGAFDHADNLKEGGRILEHKMPDGDYLIAVPTQSLQSGVELSNYELFVRDAQESGTHLAGNWNYYGQVYVGADNASSCGPDGDAPCVKSTGRIKFVDRPGQLPEIHVQFSGNEIASPGKTRTLGAEDGRVYVFDAQKKLYTPKPS